MFTPTISVRKINDNLIIKWQLSHFTIPLEDILEVTEDDTYG
ncbi:SunI/YnzG family protein, partial [Priestia megaterium]